MRATAERAVARALYARVRDLPIISPHGHTDPQWFADDAPFPDASALFITPDHYVFRMLYSQGIRLEDLGIPRRDGGAVGGIRAQAVHGLGRERDHAAAPNQVGGGGNGLGRWGFEAGERIAEELRG